jgi:hypothetical protein
MKRGMVVMLLGAFVVWIATTAGAHVVVTRGKTTITHDATVPLGHGRFLIGGAIQSPHDFCKLRRIVRVTAHYPDGNKRRVGLDVTSIGRGAIPGDFTAAWALSANLTGADRVKAKVRKEVVRGLTTRHRHTRKIRVVCSRAAIVFSVPAS